MESDFDFILRNGQVIDGTGAPSFRADVGIEGDRIAAIGDLSQARAVRDLDCAGLSVVPGLIDVHSHSDAYLLIEPGAPSKIYQGITTEVIGVCGASAAPLAGESKLTGNWDLEYPGAWSTMAEYRELLENRGVGINVFALVGHGNIRKAVMGYDARPATRDELRAMVRLLEQGLDEGAGGFSTGLIYEPSKHALPEEVDELARCVAAAGGVYASHIRDEGPMLLESLEEAITVSRNTGVKLQISHLKTQKRENWHKAEAAVNLIETARGSGLRVFADRYPYLASNTTLSILLPSWAKHGGAEGVLARLRDAALRKRIADEMEAEHSPQFGSKVQIGGTSHPLTEKFRGIKLDEAASELGMSHAEALLWVVEHDQARTNAYFFDMCEENLNYFLEQPWMMAGSDGALHAPTGVLSRFHPHPRAYGSHANFLVRAREHTPFDLPEAVRRMTSLPAEAFGMKGRGVIKRGSIADLAVFNADTVRDRATYAEPHRLATGVEHVFVSGGAALLYGCTTHASSGRWIVPNQN